MTSPTIQFKNINNKLDKYVTHSTLNALRNWLLTESMSSEKRALLVSLILYTQKQFSKWLNLKPNENRITVCETIFKNAELTDELFFNVCKLQLSKISDKKSSLKVLLQESIQKYNRTKPYLAAISIPPAPLPNDKPTHLSVRLDLANTPNSTDARITTPVKIEKQNETIGWAHIPHNIDQSIQTNTASSASDSNANLPIQSTRKKPQPTRFLASSPTNFPPTPKWNPSSIPASQVPQQIQPTNLTTESTQKTTLKTSLISPPATSPLLSKLTHATLFGLGMGIKQLHESLDDWDMFGAIPHGLQATFYYTALSFAFQLAPTPNNSMLLALIAGGGTALNSWYHIDLATHILHPLNSLAGPALEGLGVAAWAYFTTANSSELDAEPTLNNRHH
jgi:hypothetical protein